MVPRWSQASPVGFFAAADLRRGGCTPHSFSSWRKRMRRARWKKKPLGPNLPVRASLGMRTVVSHDRIKPAGSHPSALKRSYQITLMPQVVTLPQISGVLIEAPNFQPRCRSVGVCFQRGGRSPLFWSFSGVVWRGNHEIPLLACLLDRARPVFSTGRKWGVHCPAIIMAVTSASRCGQADNQLSRQNNPLT